MWIVKKKKSSKKRKKVIVIIVSTLFRTRNNNNLLFLVLEQQCNGLASSHACMPLKAFKLHYLIFCESKSGADSSTALVISSNSINGRR